jgi:hypothetical protein
MFQVNTGSMCVTNWRRIVPLILLLGIFVSLVVISLSFMGVTILSDPMGIDTNGWVMILIAIVIGLSILGFWVWRSAD